MEERHQRIRELEKDILDLCYFEDKLRRYAARGCSNKQRAAIETELEQIDQKIKLAQTRIKVLERFDEGIAVPLQRFLKYPPIETRKVTFFGISETAIAQAAASAN